MKSGVFTLQNIILIDPENLNESAGSITVEDGRIADIDGAARGMEIDGKGAYLAPGIIDMGVKICEPGERHKESFRSAGNSALAGGITSLVTRPDTMPAIDTPEVLHFFQRRSSESANVKILPIAALTKNLEEKELTEMSFLLDGGAIAFSNGLQTIQDSKLYLRALNYASELNALVIGHPQDFSLSQGASATSSAFSTKLGLSSVSPIAEKMGLQRDLILADATGIRFHVDQITTASALSEVTTARSNGQTFTVGTSIHHLTLNELDIHNYRTFFKLTPPLRSEDDRSSLLNAVVNGTIDTISSFHSPQDEESKRLPFEIAATGAVGLQTLLPASLSLVNNGYISLPHLFRLLSLNPAKILKQPTGRIAIGAPADLILFEKNTPFILDRFKLLSKSKNTPFDETRMQGRVHKTYVEGNLHYEWDGS